MDHFNETRWPALSLTTPLGCPVVPEVYRIYNGSLPLTGTISAGLTSLMASFQETSKSAFNFTLNCSR